MLPIKGKKVLLIAILIFFFTSISLYLLYILSYNENKELNDAARARLKGDFIKLSHGFTHYNLQGPKDGKLVLLCHGAGTGLKIWDKQIMPLTNAGYRVLRYDRYGSGYSDRLESDYTIDIFISQAYELLEALEIDEPIIIVGRSFGSKVVSAFAYKYPEKVSKVVLTASGSFLFDYKKVPRLSLPFFKEYFIRVFSKPLMKSYLSRYKGYTENEEEFENFKSALFDQLRYKGSEKAFQQILSYDMLLAYPEAYPFLIEQNSEKNMDVCVIWGEKDKVLPLKKLAEIEKTHPNIKAIAIKDADHWVNYTHYKEFNEMLIGYLNS